MKTNNFRIVETADGFFVEREYEIKPTGWIASIKGIPAVSKEWFKVNKYGEKNTYPAFTALLDGFETLELAFYFIKNIISKESKPVIIHEVHI